ncbi:tyrosine-protein kinase-like otk [Acropora millepora]|uniref:tyrosine-protein kinase-like otk n=1 Tax=Acropora millepora TaxID=45264 RepID=UPI001CF20A75|nr:tyrosine-protein kinase-like otk [Acropora millepora]
MYLGPESDFFVDDIKLKNADRLKYLGSFVNQAPNLKTEITASIQATSHPFYSLKQRVFDNHDLSTNIKISVYKQCLLPILLYGSETWTLYSQEVKQLCTIQQRHLRSILKISWFDFAANEEVLAKSDVVDIEVLLAQSRLQWLGHVSENRTVLEKKHHVCDLESTETVKCLKVKPELNQRISWYDGSTGIKIKSEGRIEANGLSLKINNVQLDDAGTYECRGVSSTRFYTIYVNAKFTLKTPNQAFMFGDPGIIHCSALGNPAPQFQWSRQDGRSLLGFIQLTNGSLKVESIRRDDNGTYICTIKQSRGFDSISEKSQSIIVSVIGKMRKKISTLTC